MSKKDIDQGWAWVVLAAATTSLGLCSMATASIGIFQMEFLENFNGARSYISLVCSTHSGLQLFLGPVAGMICNIFSIRAGAMLGSIVFSLGLVLSSMASSFEELMLYFGVIAGTGFGIMYTSVSVITSHYFHEKRLMACGITFASPGLGYLCGPTLTRYLLETVGWRSTLGFMGCLVCQVCVLGALFFPIDEKKTNNCISVCDVFNSSSKMGEKDRSLSVPLKESVSPKRIDELKSESHLEIQRILRPSDQQQINSLLHGDSKSRESVNGSILAAGNVSPVLSIRKPLPPNAFYTSLSSVNSHNIGNYLITKDGVTISSSRPENRFLSSIQTLSPMSYRNRYGSGSLMWESHWSVQHVGTYLADEVEEEFGLPHEESRGSSCRPDFSVLRNKALWFLSLSQFFLMCGYGINFIHFPSMVVSNGIDVSVVPQLYMTQGIALIFARLIGGMFCSSEDVNILLVNFGCQAILGIAVFALPFVNNAVWVYHAFTVAFAMYYGGTYVVLTQILVKILGLRHLATGFGLQMMMAGTAIFITPSLAGWLYDITESYNLAYHVAGSLIFFGAFFVLCIQIINPVAFLVEAPQDVVIEIEEINPEEKKE